jgi:hypothetical protein
MHSRLLDSDDDDDSFLEDDEVLRFSGQVMRLHEDYFNYSVSSKQASKQVSEGRWGKAEKGEGEFSEAT